MYLTNMDRNRGEIHKRERGDQIRSPDAPNMDMCPHRIHIRYLYVLDIICTYEVVLDLILIFFYKYFIGYL